MSFFGNLSNMFGRMRQNFVNNQPAAFGASMGQRMGRPRAGGSSVNLRDAFNNWQNMYQSPDGRKLAPPTNIRPGASPWRFNRSTWSGQRGITPEQYRRFGGSRFYKGVPDTGFSLRGGSATNWRDMFRDAAGVSLQPPSESSGGADRTQQAIDRVLERMRQMQQGPSPMMPLSGKTSSDQSTSKVAGNLSWRQTFDALKAPFTGGWQQEIGQDGEWLKSQARGAAYRTNQARINAGNAIGNKMHEWSSGARQRAADAWQGGAAQNPGQAITTQQRMQGANQRTGQREFYNTPASAYEARQAAVDRQARENRESNANTFTQAGQPGSTAGASAAYQNLPQLNQNALRQHAGTYVPASGGPMPTYLGDQTMRQARPASTPAAPAAPAQPQPQQPAARPAAPAQPTPARPAPTAAAANIGRPSAGAGAPTAPAAPAAAAPAANDTTPSRALLTQNMGGNAPNPQIAPLASRSGTLSLNQTGPNRIPTSQADANNMGARGLEYLPPDPNSPGSTWANPIVAPSQRAPGQSAAPATPAAPPRLGFSGYQQPARTPGPYSPQQQQQQGPAISFDAGQAYEPPTRFEDLPKAFQDAYRRNYAAGGTTMDPQAAAQYYADNYAGTNKPVPGTPQAGVPEAAKLTFNDLPRNFQDAYRRNLASGATRMTPQQSADYFAQNYAGKGLSPGGLQRPGGSQPAAAAQAAPTQAAPTAPAQRPTVEQEVDDMIARNRRGAYGSGRGGSNLSFGSSSAMSNLERADAARRQRSAEFAERQKQPPKPSILNGMTPEQIAQYRVARGAISPEQADAAAASIQEERDLAAQERAARLARGRARRRARFGY